MSDTTSTMKQAEALIDEYGLDCATMKGRDESAAAQRTRAALLAFVRSLVEALPCATRKPTDDELREWSARHDLGSTGLTELRCLFEDAQTLTGAQPCAVAGEADKGDVVVTWDDQGLIVLVSRQDEDHRILSVIADASKQPSRPTGLPTGK